MPEKKSLENREQFDFFLWLHMN